MLAAFSLVILVAALGIMLIVDRVLRDSTLSEHGERLVGEAESLAHLMSAELRVQFENIAARGANMVSLGLTVNLAGLQGSIDRLQQFMPDYAWIGYSDKEGFVLAATGGLLVGHNVQDRPWFQAGLQGPAVIDLQDAVLLTQRLPYPNGQPLRFLDLAHPVRNEHGEILGVLAAHLSQAWLDRQINQHKHGREYASALRLSVVNPDGKTQLGESVSNAILEKISNDHRARGWFLHTDRQTKHHVISYAKLKEIDRVQHPLTWISVVQVPLETVEEAVRGIRITVMLAIVGISLIAWLAYAWLLRAVNEPIRSLMRQIHRARHEHLEIVPLIGLPREFNQVQQSMNELIGSIRAKETTLEFTLNELRKSFSGVTASFPGVLFSASLSGEGKGVFTYLSPSAGLYLGIPSTGIPIDTASLNANIAQQTLPKLIGEIKAQTRGGDSLDVMLLITGGDGRVRDLRARAKKRKISESEWIWDGMMVDVSDLIEAQKQAASADTAKSNFLASMSHEIRTPLNGILGFAQLLLHKTQDASHQADLQRIIETANMLTAILNDVLDYSKIEAGELTLETHPFKLSELTDSCVALFEADTERRGLDFRVRTEFDGDLRLVGDPTRLRQIIINLLSNAVKFTREGWVELHVVTEGISIESVRLLVSVTDTGPGMNDEQQSRLFHRFEQVDRSIYRQYGGSGLGLAIVKRLLDAMKGTITVQSATGRGSNFRVVLTLPVAPEPTDESPKHDQPMSEIFDILVVDDVAINRAILRRMLAKDGHRVTEAANGYDALQASHQNRFDLIFLDIEMPGMNGLEVCQQLRSAAGPNQSAYIVALTGYAFQTDIDRALSAGMSAHMAKPILVQSLKRMIEQYRART
jgi:signal transduction histidine kinase/ActR/RegA family two-component response regulator